MPEKNELPSLMDLLTLIDPKGYINREDAGRDIASLSLISALQSIMKDLTQDQQADVRSILNGSNNKDKSDLIEYLGSISKKDTYLKALSEFVNYWTIDFMIELYNKTSVEKKEQIMKAFPELAELARKDEA